MKITRSEGPGGALVADRDLFSTLDGRVVPGDDPEANALIARAGLPIPDALADALGIQESEKESEKRREAPARPRTTRDE
jgi:hypothetical protein